MPHTYTSLFFHCVFSTKNRRPWLAPEIRDRLWPFMGGIAREQGFVALTVGGTEDHAHVLLSLPSTLAVAKAVQLVKAGSSGWVSKTFPSLRDFEWQEGYGAFSISVSHKKDTIAYIERQVVHHRRKTFKEEFVAFLKKHGIEYDERYIWD
jgi:putative transposase